MGKLIPDKAVYIVDTTLRDGEQTAGVIFSKFEKLNIARLLDEIGVDQIEAGTPAMGGVEADAVKMIARAGLGASIMAWCRASISDIDAAIDCEVDAVEISSPVSDLHICHKMRSSRAAIIENTVKTVAYAQKNGLYISVGMEDASRADEAFIHEYIRAVMSAGAQRIRYCDTVGVLDPLAIASRIESVRSQNGVEIEVHAHNDYGMATANTITAHQAGARFLGVAVNGLGERAGNAALEEVLMALRRNGYISSYNLTGLRELCEYVASVSGRIIPNWKPVIGQAIFHHESGIHVDGILKNPLLYEPYDPSEVGLERRIVIGKHSEAALLFKCKVLGLTVNDTLISSISEEVKKMVIQRKRPLTDSEFEEIILEAKR